MKRICFLKSFLPSSSSRDFMYPLPRRTLVFERMCSSQNEHRRPSYPLGKKGAPSQVYVRSETFTSGTLVKLPRDELLHLRARRLEDGAQLTLFNELGDTAFAVLSGNEAVVKRVQESSRHSIGSRATAAKAGGVHAIVSLMKSPSRSDWLVEKLTELSIQSITFTSTSHTLSTSATERLNRWQRVSVAAAKQSARGSIPELRYVSWKDCLTLVQEQDAAFVLCAHENSLMDADTMRRISQARGVCFVVGPEGGLTDGEIADMITAGAKPIGLGAARLRVETAAMVTAGMLGQILEMSIRDEDEKSANSTGIV